MRVDQISKAMGEVLRDERRSLRLNQVEAGKRCGVHRNCVHRIEQGRLGRLEVVLRLSEGYNISLSAVYDRARFRVRDAEARQLETLEIAEAA